ncbi:MAG: NAD(P)-dependent oxidoreductase [Alphaproteobacteria bacterium]|nr:NAD(P)-dependent oxidoreductase [Alphaproteobacteria bacterium]
MGLGRMGRAMAERLEDRGANLIVWNRKGLKAKGLRARRAATPSYLADQTDLILSVMADQAAIKAAYSGVDGLLTADLSGKTVVEFCTMSPDQSKELAAKVESSGGSFLECPVGGTIAPARKGALLGLAGGPVEALETARPVLNHLTRRLEHLGPVGAGAAMKLAINLPLMVYWAALGEALGLARAGGIDPTRALDILADSSGAIGAAKTRVPPIAETVVTGDPGAVNITMDASLKDMREMVALAEAHGIASDVVSAAKARAERASDGGWGGCDASLSAAWGNVVRKD